jgi:tetratricopeptide (TPR) repeat protein
VQEDWAHVLASAGRVNEAEQVFRDIIKTFETGHHEYPDVASHCYSLANAHREIGGIAAKQNHFKQAEAEFRLAIEVHRQRAEKLPDQRGREREWRACYFDLARLLTTMDRSEEAAATYRQGLKAISVDDQFWHWYEAAAIYLAIGDQDSYRKACREMLDRFGAASADQPDLAEQTAKTCSLAPNAVSDFSQVIKLADRVVAGTERHSNYGYFALAKGLTDYRAGNFASAVEWLRRCQPNASGGPRDALAFSALAMAQHRLGHVDEANAGIDATYAIIANKTQDPNRDINWVEWMHCQILVGEADGLLKKGSTVVSGKASKNAQRDQKSSY